MMQSKPKSNSVVTHTVDEATGVITFNVIGAESFTFDPRLVAPTNRARAERHGWVQRIVDRAAINRNPETGKPATPAEKQARMVALAAHYQSGSEEWSLRVGASGPRVDHAIVQGLARVHGTDEATMRERCIRMAEKRAMPLAKYLQAVHDQPSADELRRIVAGIRASDAGLDANDMMDELGGEEEPGDTDADTDD